MRWVVVQVTCLIRWIDCRIDRRINRQISRIFYNIREIVAVSPIQVSQIPGITTTSCRNTSPGPKNTTRRNLLPNPVHDLRMLKVFLLLQLLLVHLVMPQPLVTPRKCLVTILALIWFFSGVCSLVSSDMIRPRKTSSTYCALERLFSSVYSIVSFQLVRSEKIFPADLSGDGVAVSASELFFSVG